MAFKSHPATDDERDLILRVRVSKKEMEDIEAAADSDSRSKSQFVRLHLFKAVNNQLGRKM